MDGIHDLGGKEGFGPIPIGDDAPFAHDWEERMWAMSRTGILPPGTTIDWFRHGVELLPPKDYLTYAYFNKWCTNYFMLQIDAGITEFDEILSGHAKHPGPPAPVLGLDEVLEANRRANTDFSSDAPAPPRFAVGDEVRTRSRMHSGHTRLPAYARAATGTVIAHHGAHLLADEGARGNHVGEHLYTVSFAATELWGDGAHPHDTVTLDLWESYLV